MMAKKHAVMPSILVMVVMLVVTVIADAQQLKKIPRIGLLRATTATLAAPLNEAFVQGLRALGYVEGENVLIEYRFADGQRDRLPHLAEDLTHQKVDVIVAGGNTVIRATKKITSIIPIVAASAGNLVSSGLVSSFARPGGNVTGLTLISTELSGKRLDLLKETVPRLLGVAILWNPPNPQDADEVKQTEAAGRQLGVNVFSVEVRNSNDIETAYAGIHKQQADGIIIIQSGFTNTHINELTGLAIKGGLPSMCETARWTKSGCLLSYGPDQTDMFRRAATFVDKILKGRNPADLPIEGPKQFLLEINLQTANQIGLPIPQWTLMKADRVIK